MYSNEQSTLVTQKDLVGTSIRSLMSVNVGQRHKCLEPGELCKKLHSVDLSHNKGEKAGGK